MKTQHRTTQDVLNYAEEIGLITETDSKNAFLLQKIIKAERSVERQFLAKIILNYAKETGQIKYIQLGDVLDILESPHELRKTSVENSGCNSPTL